MSVAGIRLAKCHQDDLTEEPGAAAQREVQDKLGLLAAGPTTYLVAPHTEHFLDQTNTTWTLDRLLRDPGTTFSYQRDGTPRGVERTEVCKAVFHDQRGSLHDRKVKFVDGASCQHFKGSILGMVAQAAARGYLVKGAPLTDTAVYYCQTPHDCTREEDLESLSDEARRAIRKSEFAVVSDAGVGRPRFSPKRDVPVGAVVYGAGSQSPAVLSTLYGREEVESQTE